VDEINLLILPALPTGWLRHGQAALNLGLCKTPLTKKQYGILFCSALVGRNLLRLLKLTRFHFEITAGGERKHAYCARTLRKEQNLIRD